MYQTKFNLELSLNSLRLILQRFTPKIDKTKFIFETKWMFYKLKKGA